MSGDEDPTASGDENVADAVERFLDDAEAALTEYDQGYADADATLSVIRSHLSALRDAADSGEADSDRKVDSDRK